MQSIEQMSLQVSAASVVLHDLDSIWQYTKANIDYKS